MNAPCKDCEKKGCGDYHAQCPAFIAFRKEKEKEYEKRRTQAIMKTPRNRRWF